MNHTSFNWWIGLSHNKRDPGFEFGDHSFTYAVTMYIVWVLVYLNLSIHIPTLYPRGLNYNNNYMEAFFHNFEIMFILSSEISVFIIICSLIFHNVQKWFSHEFLFHDFFSFNLKVKNSDVQMIKAIRSLNINS